MGHLRFLPLFTHEDVAHYIISAHRSGTLVMYIALVACVSSTRFAPDVRQTFWKPTAEKRGHSLPRPVEGWAASGSLRVNVGSELPPLGGHVAQLS
jgi:hypothetical protein